MKELIEKLEIEEDDLFRKIMKMDELIKSEEYKTYPREQQILVDMQYQTLNHLNTIVSYRIRELKSREGE